MTRRAAPGLPFTLTTATGAQHNARYGQRLFLGSQPGGRLDGAPDVVAIGEPGDSWISGVALEIVVNETNVAVHVNQRAPGVLVAGELTGNQRVDDIVESGRTYLTAANGVALALRPHPSSPDEVPVGEFGFRPAGFYVGHRGTVEVTVSTPHTMWMRCIVAAVSVYRTNHGPASWRQVHEWLVDRGCWQQGRPGDPVPQAKDAQQFTAWEAIRAYRLQPSEYSTARTAEDARPGAAAPRHTDLWRSVQRALFLKGFPTPAEVNYVEQHLSQYWVRYGRAVPNPVE